jgi:hypothetical protein
MAKAINKQSRTIELPFFAVQRSALNRWIVWAPSLDPCAPAVRIVAVLEEPSYSGAEKRRGDNVIRSFRSWQSRIPETQAEINDIAWPRDELLEVARLLDHLATDFHDPELFHVQKSALAAELRRLARWAAPRG